MKNALLFFAWLGMSGACFAEIRNGYLREITEARCKVVELRRWLAEACDSEGIDRRDVRSALKKYEEIIIHYQLTQALLQEFSMIAPDMYHQMYELRDRRGRRTDIYVRFISAQNARLLLRGASFFQNSAGDRDGSYSLFGEFTVAIDVLISPSALTILAHEFGHTWHIVPNLAAYRDYYLGIYGHAPSPHVGHHGTDDSGRLAYAFEHRFIRARRLYRSATGHSPMRVTRACREVYRGRHDLYPEQEALTARSGGGG